MFKVTISKLSAAWTVTSAADIHCAADVVRWTQTWLRPTRRRGAFVPKSSCPVAPSISQVVASIRHTIGTERERYRWIAHLSHSTLTCSKYDAGSCGILCHFIVILSHESRNIRFIRVSAVLDIRDSRVQY